MKPISTFFSHRPILPTSLLGLAVVASVPARADNVIQEWNFTGGSLLSESGLGTGFFGTVPDTDGDDQYTVTRGDGNSGTLSLGTAVTASTADYLTVSVTLAGFDFSNNNDQQFDVRLRTGTTTVGNLRLDAQTAADSGTVDRTRLAGTAVAGIALNSTVSSTPITYGMTLSFLDNTYTYWIGTPDSDESTWVSRYLNHTGPLDLSSTTIDGLQWGIANSAAGNSFTLDQVRISTSIIPEPSSATLAGLGALLVLAFRKRA